MISAPVANAEDFMDGLAAFQAFANACGEDSDLHARVVSDPKAVLADKGLEYPAEIDVRVVMNTDDTFYLAFPPDPNVSLGDEMLNQVAGGKSASTVGSVGSASTVGCIGSTFSSASSAGSVGSGGSASVS